MKYTRQLVLCIWCLLVVGCGGSTEENMSDDERALLEDTYYEGYFRALACVKRKGGSAESSARDCENDL